jgi:hypothetical protein
MNPPDWRRQAPRSDRRAGAVPLGALLNHGVVRHDQTIHAGDGRNRDDCDPGFAGHPGAEALLDRALDLAVGAGVLVEHQDRRIL